MIHDDSSITMGSRIYTAEATVTEDDTSDPEHVNDDSDDVFGSAPGSPTTPHDELEDSFARSRSGNAEISDIPRLKEKHHTEGYRDGVTKGKAEIVQKGFDEGYSLGATLGLQIGKILGLLEGIYHAVESAVKDADEDVKGECETQRVRMEGLWKAAKDELKTESVFGRDWWGEDGIWTFEVRAENEGEEVSFPDVAAAHPLVAKWEKTVQEEVQRWGLDLGVMGHVDEEDDIGKAPKVAKEEVHTSTAPGAVKELAW